MNSENNSRQAIDLRLGNIIQTQLAACDENHVNSKQIDIVWWVEHQINNNID